MLTKDRLAELRQASAGAVYADTVEPLGAPQHDAAIEEVFKEAERIHAWLCELRGATQRVRALAAHPAYHNDAGLQRQLEQTAARAGALGAELGAALRGLEARAQAARCNSAAARITRLQYAAARAHFAAALHDHHAALAALAHQRRKLLHHQIQLTNLSVSEEECERLLESRQLSMFVDNVAAETAEARRALRDLEARHADLARLEASLAEVRDMFAQLALLVAAQQEQVDSVEYYALQATEHVESGQHHLLKGTVSRAKTRKKKMGLIVCLVTGIFIVLLVLVYT